MNDFLLTILKSGKMKMIIRRIILKKPTMITIYN